MNRVVEWLIVFIVLAVIASMMLPVIHPPRHGVPKKSCMNCLRQMGLNELNYNQSEGRNEYFSTGSAEEGSNNDLIGRQFVIGLWNPTDPDLKEKKIYLCPGAKGDPTPTPSMWNADGSSAYTPGHPPTGERVPTHYFGWDEDAAQANDMRATQAGTTFVVIMDQDASGGADTNNHADGINCLFGDGHVEFLTFESGIRDARSLHDGTAKPNYYREPTAILAAGKTKIVLPAHPGAWTRGWEVNFITKATGK